MSDTHSTLMSDTHSILMSDTSSVSETSTLKESHIQSKHKNKEQEKNKVLVVPEVTRYTPIKFNIKKIIMFICILMGMLF